MVDGQLKYVHVGGVLDVLPDRLFCYDCGEEQGPPPPESGEQALRIVHAALPESLARNLVSGFNVWEEGSEESL